jgi:hypothetical protein
VGRNETTGPTCMGKNTISSPEQVVYSRLDLSAASLVE